METCNFKILQLCCASHEHLVAKASDSRQRSAGSNLLGRLRTVGAARERQEVLQRVAQAAACRAWEDMISRRGRRVMKAVKYHHSIIRLFQGRSVRACRKHSILRFACRSLLQGVPQDEVR